LFGLNGLGSIGLGKLNGCIGLDWVEGIDLDWIGWIGWMDCIALKWVGWIGWMNWIA